MNIPGALSTFTLVMNKAAWEGLSPEEQDILRAVTGEALSVKAAQAFKAAGDRGVELLNEAEVELIELTPEALAEFENAMEEPLAAFIAKEGQKAGFDGPAFLDRFRGSN